jgi:hypothetical protein
MDPNASCRRDLPEYRQAQGDHGLPNEWGMQVNRACTAWLHKRGLLASQMEPRLGIAQRAAAQARRIKNP